MGVRALGLVPAGFALVDRAHSIDPVPEPCQSQCFSVLSSICLFCTDGAGPMSIFFLASWQS